MERTDGYNDLAKWSRTESRSAESNGFIDPKAYFEWRWDKSFTYKGGRGRII
jgi:hypothetical protein